MAPICKLDRMGLKTLNAMCFIVDHMVISLKPQVLLSVQKTNRLHFLSLPYNFANQIMMSAVASVHGDKRD